MVAAMRPDARVGGLRVTLADLDHAIDGVRFTKDDVDILVARDGSSARSVAACAARALGCHPDALRVTAEAC